MIIEKETVEKFVLLKSKFKGLQKHIDDSGLPLNLKIEIEDINKINNFETQRYLLQSIVEFNYQNNFKKIVNLSRENRMRLYPIETTVTVENDARRTLVEQGLLN